LTESDTFKTEMEITFREIQEVNEQIHDSDREIRELNRIMDERERYLRQAERGPDREEARGWARTLEIDNRELRALENKRHQLKDKRSALWDRHNAAKDEWRRGRSGGRS
jgi:chromosome segregation ATPase